MQRDPLIVGNIVGDIVDYFDASARLRVLYGNREITVGSELRPSHVANQPTVQITGLSRSFYTLVSDQFYAQTFDNRMRAG
jgi:protein FLOWERING LOCUS T